MFNLKPFAFPPVVTLHCGETLPIMTIRGVLTALAHIN